MNLHVILARDSWHTVEPDAMALLISSHRRRVENAYLSTKAQYVFNMECCMCCKNSMQHIHRS
jgi:hypothetical protein